MLKSCGTEQKADVRSRAVCNALRGYGTSGSSSPVQKGKHIVFQGGKEQYAGIFRSSGFGESGSVLKEKVRRVAAEIFSAFREWQATTLLWA